MAHKTTKIPAGTLFPVVTELLQQGKDVEITVRGNSMYPFIRSNTDTALLQPVVYSALKPLDIVLIRRCNGDYILHRIHSVRPGGLLIIGDAQRKLEGPIRPDQVIARAKSIQRGRLFIGCTSTRWRLLARLWMLLRPIRPWSVRLYIRLWHMHNP